MRSILLEVNHPGQVHLFKYIYKQLIGRGNKVIVITKENNSIEYLLKVYKIPYKIIGKKKDGILQKAFLQLLHNLNALKIIINNNIQIGIGSSITNDHLSIMTKMKSIHFSDDDEDQVPLISKFSYPFSDLILAPDSLTFKKFSHKTLGYAGTHELAYLHPNKFKPNIEIISRLGLKKGDTYFVLRFVALKGHHDIGQSGININQKRQLINFLEPFGRIFITSESPIEEEFEKFRIPVAPEEIHSLLYYAKMFIGDSQTMTSEACILGTPALKCNTFAGKLSVPNELEKKYNLCFSYKPDQFNALIEKAKELLLKKDLDQIWNNRLKIFLNDKIDVTNFMVWFIEKYPESRNIISKNKNYQFKFK
tara:strand:+ start:1834 stop:2928 length:1095 start_codon:yes stop_codon:yes gene_type:complete